MSLVISEQPIDVLIPQGEQLLADNWAETGFDFPVVPDWDVYRQVEATGRWFVMAAVKDGKLVGYSSAFVVPHPFNRSIETCASEALFVAREHRHGTLVPRLIAATEASARTRGATRMLWHTRAGTPFAGMLEKREYTEVDVVMMRRI